MFHKNRLVLLRLLLVLKVKILQVMSYSPYRFPLKNMVFSYKNWVKYSSKAPTIKLIIFAKFISIFSMIRKEIVEFIILNILILRIRHVCTILLCVYALLIIGKAKTLLLFTITFIINSVSEQAKIFKKIFQKYYDRSALAAKHKIQVYYKKFLSFRLLDASRQTLISNKTASEIEIVRNSYTELPLFT